MATGFNGIWLKGVSINDVKLWNSVMDEVSEAILKEFLPSLGLKWDFRGERDRDRLLDHVLRPSFASGWVFDEVFGEKGGVFVFGPFSQGSRDLKNMTIFCSFPNYGDVRTFFEKLDKFVADKVKEILEEKKEAVV